MNPATAVLAHTEAAHEVGYRPVEHANSMAVWVLGAGPATILPVERIMVNPQHPCTCGGQALQALRAVHHVKAPRTQLLLCHPTLEVGARPQACLAAYIDPATWRQQHHGLARGHRTRPRARCAAPCRTLDEVGWADCARANLDASAGSFWSLWLACAP